jgi:hypothetical protein
MVGGALKGLFEGITSGGVIGIFVGIPLGVSIAFVDVNAIHPAFYEAIAAAIPVLLLAVVLLIRGEGNAIDQLEEPRRQRRVEVEDILKEVQREAVGVEGGEAKSAEDTKTQMEDRLRQLLDRLDVEEPLTPILVLLYISFAVGTLGEVAALVALGSGSSNMATYLSTGLGVLGLLLLLVMLERNAITRASDSRRTEKMIEAEFAAQKRREGA